jgi:hypothetical protein
MRYTNEELLKIEEDAKKDIKNLPHIKSKKKLKPKPGYYLDEEDRLIVVYPNLTFDVSIGTPYRTEFVNGLPGFYVIRSDIYLGPL